MSHGDNTFTAQLNLSCTNNLYCSFFLTNNIFGIDYDRYIVIVKRIESQTIVSFKKYSSSLTFKENVLLNVTEPNPGLIQFITHNN